MGRLPDNIIKDYPFCYVFGAPHGVPIDKVDVGVWISYDDPEIIIPDDHVIHMAQALSVGTTVVIVTKTEAHLDIARKRLEPRLRFALQPIQGQA